MSKKRKSTTKTSIEKLYAVTMNYSTIKDWTDSNGVIIPAGTKYNVTYIVSGVKGIETALNITIGMDHYEFNEVQIKPLDIDVTKNGDVDFNNPL